MPLVFNFSLKDQAHVTNFIELKMIYYGLTSLKRGLNPPERVTVACVLKLVKHDDRILGGKISETISENRIYPIFFFVLSTLLFFENGRHRSLTDLTNVHSFKLPIIFIRVFTIIIVQYLINNVSPQSFAEDYNLKWSFLSCCWIR